MILEEPHGALAQIHKAEPFARTYAWPHLLDRSAGARVPAASGGTGSLDLLGIISPLLEPASAGRNSAAVCAGWPSPPGPSPAQRREGNAPWSSLARTLVFVGARQRVARPQVGNLYAPCPPPPLRDRGPRRPDCIAPRPSPPGPSPEAGEGKEVLKSEFFPFSPTPLSLRERGAKKEPGPDRPAVAWVRPNYPRSS